ncbi:DNA adenine methylase [Methanobrevibacter filiformis]|uniref:Modification methylase DpnIIA n=1 Tax=Methanobrevibacter filiformis TaxID=55758 RepID=A0A166CU63_9EURY|nr:modification methylase DpnIIA [Methanobrevibacter filiformis]
MTQKDLYGTYDIFTAKPFLKWAGGKTQLINAIEERLPEKIRKTHKIDEYFEPFIGGGGIIFLLIQ